ncbi:MAG: beta strand repeat-containing protein [Mucilaginibacter sp.]
MSDKKISDLPVASVINASDVSVLVSNGTDYQYAFASLLQLIGSNITVGANIAFGTILPQNNTGNNGDVFINTTTGSFAQKLAGTWTIVYTIPSSGASTNGTVLYGPGVPGNSTGNNNDTYINTGTGIFYKKSSGSWSQVFSMQTGPAGAPGSAGANGTNGTNGFSILNGAGTPSNTSTGNNGDFYINTTNYTLFGPKTAGNWGSSVSIIGSGFATGGSTGQLLAKIDGTDFNTGWVDPLSINDSAASTTKVFSSQHTADLLNGKQNTLGFTAENTANKNTANGYAGLDGTGKVAAAQLPSYVDDVLEFANIAALPTSGETGKIYVTLDTNNEYRWSGSTYIQLVPSPGSTDALAEGSTNLYLTVARVLATVLTGLSLGTVSAVAATDTILQGFGKLQAQINAFAASISTGAIGVTGGGVAVNKTDNSFGTYLSADGLKAITGIDGTANFTAYGRQAVSMNYSGVNYLLNLPLKNGTLALTGDISAPSVFSGSAAGTNTYTTSITGIMAYATNQQFFILFSNANTGASTININSLGAKSIVKNASSTLVGGEIIAGEILCLQYDGTNFQIVGSTAASGGGASKISYNFYQTVL